MGQGRVRASAGWGMCPFDGADIQGSCIRTVPVRRGVYDGASPQGFSAALTGISNALLVFGAYTADELPMPLQYHQYVSQYLEQVSSGGHEQFLANGGSSPAVQRMLDAALGAIGAISYQLLFRDIAMYLNVSDEILTAVSARDGVNHPANGSVERWLGRKDSAFFELNKTQPLMLMLHVWLKQQPRIQPVDDLQWKFRMADIIEDNPHRDARLGEAGQQKRDFIRELIENAPMEKTRHEYACAIANEHGIALPCLPRKTWQDVIDGVECRFGYYVTEDDHFVAACSRTAMALYRLKKKLLGKGLTLGKKLGALTIEYEDV